MDQFYLPNLYLTKVEWSDLPLYSDEETHALIRLLSDQSFVDHLEILVCLLAIKSRLTFELVNDHFNSLGDDDSVVSKKFLFKFGFVEVRFSFCFRHFFSSSNLFPTADRLVVGILPAKILSTVIGIESRGVKCTPLLQSLF